MNEQLISFETAKLAKEKGFSEYGDYFYTEEDGLCLIDSDGKILNIYDENLKQVDYRYDCNGDFWYKDHDNDLFESYIPIKYIAPTQSLLQKWLREKHNLNLCVSPFYGLVECIKEINEGIKKEKKKLFATMIWENTEIVTEGYETYEEALEMGLQEALKLI